MSALPDLIGVCGYARSGKTTLAGWLVEHRGFTAVSPSLLIKRSLHALNPIVGFDNASGCIYPVHVADLVADVDNESDWDTAKAGPYGRELRALLQRLGGEASRQIVGENVWAGPVLEQADKIIAAGGKAVIPSVRHHNEADAILDAGGVMVRVLREDTGPVNGHGSETEMDNYPVHVAVYNDGTPTELGECVENHLSVLNVVSIDAAIDRATALEQFTDRTAA